MTALVVMLSVLTSCNNRPKGYEASDNGLYYRFYVKNDGDKPELGDLIDVTISCSVNDTIVIIPSSKNIIQLMEPSFTSDFMEGLAMMHKGDSASFIVDIDTCFMYLFNCPVLPQDFNSTDIMRFNIKVNDFYSESEYKTKQIESIKDRFPEETEKAAADMQEYFEKNGVVAQPTASGLYYVKTQDGNGEMPVVGSIVKVHYNGKLLNGEVFDSSYKRGEPIEFKLGVGYVILGWDEGIALMSKGEKGVLYIPYYLGYADMDLGVIPAFSNLIFEVELVDFE
ncbi:MAG: FKBP-type peptidyl-prolyl cis-trans isomerase [Candidatus Limimorpha sp.]